MLRKILLVSALGMLSIPITTFASDAAPAKITITRGANTVTTFAPFSGIGLGAIGGIAAGDLGRDGVKEILVGAGAGTLPTVAVFRQDGSFIGSFLAYTESFTGGVNVAACDVDGDGISEIVTGAKFGGGPHVRVFDALGNPRTSFFAYATDFRGGVNVACGDVDGDGIAEIVTGAGPTGGPHVKVYSGEGNIVAETFNGDATHNTGTYVAVDNNVILSVAMVGEPSIVRTFAVVNGILAPAQTVTSITREKIFTQATLTNDGAATADVTNVIANDTSAQYVVVDVSEQRLTAYAYGIPVNTFLISSGTYAFPTPYDKTPITAKIPMKNYSGVDYWFPNTPWNLRFRNRYYIHTAYWHNNFGQRMSHGCINTKLEDAKWIYDWVNIGTMVEIIP